MEFEGVVFRKLPEMSGMSAKGAWRKQDVVFELPSEFNRKICVTFFGDKAEDVASLTEGDAVTVSVNVDSREYNGKWYTDVKAWKIVRAGTNNPPPAPTFDTPFDEKNAPSTPDRPDFPSGIDDDLPF
jgi:hypothetical protein